MRMLGYRVVRLGNPVRTYGECLRALRDRGFEPASVIDVGVADGTPDLYAGCPDTPILLVEPVEEYRPALEVLCQRYRASYVIAAAGAVPGSAELRVGQDRRKSSMVRPAVRGGASGHRVVPVVTLNDLIREHGLRPPHLLKVDVEGAELAVLAGADRVLAETPVVILEVSVRDATGVGPELHEVVTYMKRAGFVVYDIVGAVVDRDGGGLQHVDLVFVHEHATFRRGAGARR
jgi:FkbM family methyltransferase